MLEVSGERVVDANEAVAETVSVAIDGHFDAMQAALGEPNDYGVSGRAGNTASRP